MTYSTVSTSVQWVLSRYYVSTPTTYRVRKSRSTYASFGVSFALLDFAEQFPMPLKNTVIMETGGMKGRRKEVVREELHGVLGECFHLDSIHSEYGMTELLSQAYSKQGIFMPTLDESHQ